MNVFEMSNTYTIKFEYTDFFPVPEAGDLYVFRTPDSLCSVLKIHTQFSTDSFAIIHGIEKIEIERAQSTVWANDVSRDDGFFKLNSKVDTNLAGLNDFFEQENFLAIYRITTKHHSEIKHSEASPWYVSLIGSFLAFPIVVFLAFVINWLTDETGIILHQKNQRIPAKIGYYFLIILGIFLFSLSVYNEFIFSNLAIAGLYGSVCMLLPMIAYRHWNTAYFQNKSFANQEALRFLTLVVAGIFANALAYWVCWSICKIFPEILKEPFFWHPEVLLYPSILVWTALAAGNFINNLRQNFKELRTREKELAKSQKNELSSKAELDALQARINPHFLYNSLNSIASLAQVDPKKTEEMAIALSQFYKYSTNRGDEYLTSVKEEIAILKTYLEIEKIRFGERLQFEIDTKDLKNEWQIPRFLLQLLAENAVKYGYDKSTNQIFIQVKILDSAEQLIIHVLDSGAPFSENMKIGYGLSSIQKKVAIVVS